MKTAKRPGRDDQGFLDVLLRSLFLPQIQEQGLQGRWTEGHGTQDKQAEN